MSAERLYGLEHDEFLHEAGEPLLDGEPMYRKVTTP